MKLSFMSGGHPCLWKTSKLTLYKTRKQLWCGTGGRNNRCVSPELVRKQGLLEQWRNILNFWFVDWEWGWRWKLGQSERPFLLWTHQIMFKIWKVGQSLCTAWLSLFLAGSLAFSRKIQETSEFANLWSSWWRLKWKKNWAKITRITFISEMCCLGKKEVHFDL